MEKLPKNVRLVEVGPRDGLQNEPSIIPTDKKIEFIRRLSETGLKSIEVTSFVSPKRIPQLADGAIVFANLPKKSDVRYSALVPNWQGMKQAVEVGAKEVCVFTAASETFSQKNTHCSIEESFDRITDIFKLAKEHNILVRGYISCALGCPYEGDISPETVLGIAKRLKKLGCFEIALGDTIGIGTPGKVKQLIQTLTKDISVEHLAVHFHDTYGQALANIYACLQLGVSVVDCSISGLGGCPYAKGATGNVATEDVLYMLQGLGIQTGVDLKALLKVSQFVKELTKHPLRSKVAEAKLDQEI